MKTRSRMYTVLMLVAVFVVTPLAAAGQSSSPRNRARLENWQHRMEKVDGLLLEGEHKKALKHVDRLIDHMVNEITEGDARSLFSVVCLLRALAEAGLGQERDALWDYQMARALDEKIGGKDLSAYGDAGAFLSKPRESAWERAQSTMAKADDVTPPTRTEESAPIYPAGKSATCRQGTGAMQAIIDEKGIPQEPRLQEKGDPLLGFVLMWSFRYWRFEPATLDGEPVPFVFDFEVTFKLPRCN